MGLPLYMAPVESDLRKKAAASFRGPSAQSRSTIRRLRRRSAEAMRESRRRAILSVAANNHINERERERERDQERRAAERTGQPSSSSGLVPSTTRQRLLDQFLQRAQLQRQATSGGGVRDWQRSATGSGPGSGSGPPSVLVTWPSNPRMGQTPTVSTGIDNTMTAPLSPQRQPRAPRSDLGIGRRLAEYQEDNFHEDDLDDGENAHFGVERDQHGLEPYMGPEFADLMGLDGDGIDFDTEPNTTSSANNNYLTLGSRAQRRVSSLRSRTTNYRSRLRRMPREWPVPGDPTSRSRETSQSRVFGGRGEDAYNDEGATNSSRGGWSFQYSNLPQLPPIRSVFGGQVDGLGDRSRSLSPEGDDVWDTLLSTLTPDPEPPSVGSSFASTAPALAPASTEPSSQATVTLTPTASATVPTTVPVSTLVSQPPTGHAATGTRSARSTSVGASGTTSASTSERVASPFTSVSASTDTADESAVPQDDADEPLRILELYPFLDPNRNTEQDADPECDGSDMEGEHTFMVASDNDGRLYYRVAATNRRSRGNDGDNNNSNNSSSNNNSSNSNSGGNTSENASNNNQSRRDFDPINVMGVGTMQNILRNLAQREDISDEWWAEAGLSRTLARGASN